MKLIKIWLAVFTAMIAGGGGILWVNHTAKIWQSEAEEIRRELMARAMKVVKHETNIYKGDPRWRDQHRSMFETSITLLEYQVERAKKHEAQRVLFVDRSELIEAINATSNPLEEAKRSAENMKR